MNRIGSDCGETQIRNKQKEMEKENLERPPFRGNKFSLDRSKAFVPL